MTPIYLDVHVPAAITVQLRRQGVDVITAQEDGGSTLTDTELLERSTALGRVMFTQDIRVKALAEQWQRAGRNFGGLVFGHQLHGSVGQYVRNLLLIAQSTDAEEWIGQVEQLPLR